MQRIDDGPVRDNYRELVRNQGLVYVDTYLPGHPEPISYWREGQYYLLDDSEVKRIGKAGARVYQALVDIWEEILRFERPWHGDPTHKERDCYFRRLSIPDRAVGPIMRTWQIDNADLSPNNLPEHYPTIYGRFDLGLILDERGKVAGVKVLEFNADTPTSVVETADIQAKWYEDLYDHFQRRHGNVYQWNELFEQLVEAWKAEIRKYERITGKRVTVVHSAFTEAEEEGEDALTAGVMYDALRTASRELSRDGQNPAFRVELITMESINRVPTSESTDTYVVGTMGPDGTLSAANQGVIPGYFVDGSGQRIEMIFKLHPWEFFLDPRHTRHGFGETAMHDMMSASPTIWVEPIYKMLWSNKGVWALLWEKYKNDPEISQFLLPTFFPDDPAMPVGFQNNCARKALLGREGASVTLYKDGMVLEHNDGTYGNEGYVLQELCELPEFQDRNEGAIHPVAGLWMVRDDDAGLCFRESGGLITNNTSYFVPHLVREGH